MAGSASGLRPSASIAPAAMIPMPIPGPIAPSPIASAAARRRTPASAIGSRSPPLRVLLLVVPGATGLAVLGVALARERHEHQRQDGEDEGLNEADEQLESVERQGHEPRQQEDDDRDQDFAREDVAEE